MASVTLEHLSKIYSNGFVSVNDVSLRVDNGEFITLHGPSGCGKSTILRMIGGLEDITSGKIYLGDELLNDILPRDRRLAMAFQNYTLYKQPKVLLVDEDFARQDPERRKEMLCDILEINEELKITVLYVTNDPLEARTLGKKIVFMKDGKITDIG